MERYKYIRIRRGGVSTNLIDKKQRFLPARAAQAVTLSAIHFLIPDSWNLLVHPSAPLK